MPRLHRSTISHYLRFCSTRTADALFRRVNAFAVQRSAECTSSSWFATAPLVPRAALSHCDALERSLMASRVCVPSPTYFAPVDGQQRAFAKAKRGARNARLIAFFTASDAVTALRTLDASKYVCCLFFFQRCAAWGVLFVRASFFGVLYVSGRLRAGKSVLVLLLCGRRRLPHPPLWSLMTASGTTTHSCSTALCRRSAPRVPIFVAACAIRVRSRVSSVATRCCALWRITGRCA